MSNTYAIASAKGGVGKTTTVANLGAALAAADEDVVVVDADIGMANLADTLGVDPDGATLHDVLAGTAALEDALYEGADGLTVLPGSAELEDYRTADLDGLTDVLATLAEDHEHVLVDTGAGLSHDTVLPLELVDEVLLVSTPQPQALGDTDKTRGLVERLGGSVAGLVLTRAGAEATAAPVAAAIVGRIPDDPAIDEAVIAGEPVVSFAPDSPAAGAYRTLVGELFAVDVAAPEPGVDAAEATAVADSETDAGAGGGAAGGSEADSAADTPDSDVVAAEADATDAEADAADVEAADAEADAADVEAADAEADATDGKGADAAADAADIETADAVPSSAPESDAAEEQETTKSTASDGDTMVAAESDEATNAEESDNDSNVERSDNNSDPERSDTEPAPEDPDNDSNAEDDKPTSVGPHRTEDVPVSEAEPGVESPEGIDPTMGEETPEEVDAEPNSGSESKGFFSRLLGR